MFKMATVTELEAFWGTHRDEWQFGGPPLEDSDIIRFQKREDEDGWRTEREEHSMWYVCDDELYTDQDIPPDAYTFQQ